MNQNLRRDVARSHSACGPSGPSTCSSIFVLCDLFLLLQLFSLVTLRLRDKVLPSAIRMSDDSSKEKLRVFKKEGEGSLQASCQAPTDPRLRRKNCLQVLVPTLRMNGTIPSFLLHAIMTCTGKTLPFIHGFKTRQVSVWLCPPPYIHH